MRRNPIALLFILVSLLATSCAKSPFANGKPVSETRNVHPNFRIISIYNNVNVKLIHSNRPRLELTCPENLIDHITTETKGDTLFIKNENKHNWLRSYDYDINLTVYYDSLSEINYSSIGRLYNVEGDSIRGVAVRQNDTLAETDEWNPQYIQSFSLNVEEGAGDIDLTLCCTVFKSRFTNGTSLVTIKGTANYSEYNTRNYGAIHAEDLQTTFSRVRTESSNDVYVAPSNLLRVWLFSIGNVYYKGNPNVVVETHSGNGQVIRLE